MATPPTRPTRSSRPYVLLSCAMSVDGYIDDTGPQRLVLSGDADWDRVDQTRADSDAVLVGATTLRNDNPRLLVKSAARRAARERRGLPAHPLKVTLTASGDLDPDLRFWHHGGRKLVYCPDAVAVRLRDRLGDLAEVTGLGDGLDLAAMLDDLGGRGVRRLMVEGGGTVHTQFLVAGLADEIQLAVAPFFVGDENAPRFVTSGAFPQDAAHRMALVEARPVGDIALLRYLPARATDAEPPANRRPQQSDHQWMETALELARRCPPSDSAYSVGAVIVDADGREIARGHSRENDPYAHAEEAALAKLPAGDPRLRTATLYSTLEPCSRRGSRSRSCTRRILDAGIPRVVIAWREPSLFVDGQGYELLSAEGVIMVELPDLADRAKAANAHLAIDSS